MTVLENVLVGAHTRMRPFSERKGRARRSRRSSTSTRPAHAARPAAGLPFGTLKRVDLARALASKPRLLLLDEPAGGLNHEEVEELSSLIRALRKDFELTVLLVEHHMSLVMSVASASPFSTSARRSPRARPRRCRPTRRSIEAYLGAPSAAA